VATRLGRKSAICRILRRQRLLAGKLWIWSKAKQKKFRRRHRLSCPSNYVTYCTVWTWPCDSSSPRVVLVDSRWEDPVQAVLASSQVAFGTHAGIYLRSSDIGCQYSRSIYTGTSYRRSWNCCDWRTCFVVIWKHFCFILSTGTKIRIDSVMRPRSSSRGRNTSASASYSYDYC